MFNLGISKYVILALSLLTAGLGWYTNYLSNKLEEQMISNGVLKQNVTAATIANDNLINQIEMLNKSLSQLSKEKKEIEEKIQVKKNIFDEHDLERLSKRKPKLIENKMNKGIQKIFDELEE